MDPYTFSRYKSNREYIEQDLRNQEIYFKQQKCDHFETYKTERGEECVYCGIVLRSKKMKVVEVIREWSDYLAEYVLRGYKQGKFVRDFANEKEAEQWLTAMEKHYNELKGEENVENR